MGIRISGVGAYVPETRVTNQELVGRIDTTNEWIVARTGIRERRVAGPDEAPSDLACRAAQRCLDYAGLDKSAVDLLVVATSSPDQIQPAVACMVQEKLGIAEHRCPAFDVNSVCAGFMYALSVAQGMMLTDPDQYRNVLVIGAETYSKILNWDDRTTCVFFGDGAGAMLLSHTDEHNRRIHFRLGSDGRGHHHIGVPAGGTRLPVTCEILKTRQNTFHMDGRAVWDFAVNTVPGAIRDLLSRQGQTPADLDLLILHQSNLRMIEKIMESLQLPMTKTATTVEMYGNTAAASLPLTLNTALEQGRLRRGDRVAMCGFGGGLSGDRPCLNGEAKPTDVPALETHR